ncbi:competence protein CoiA [Paenisporosarcina quisquiliarum]|uniref:competence protein CoiA n=1 Tax=Paenisporosarcina quisquiliarum TaxID=365346 RepID=UPI0037351C47
MQKALLRNRQVNLIEKVWKESREYLKHDLQKNDFVCPQCKEAVGLHWAIPTKKIPHFKHKSKKDCTYGLGESEEHNAGKIKLFNYFKEVFACKLEIIDIEHFIPETKQIADIFIQFKTGERWVIEYQRSNIPIQDIQRRRALYRSLNINDIWIAGENLVRSDNLVTVNLLNAAQELRFADFFKMESLITFNPDNEEVTIYRGLEQLNQNSFIKNDVYQCLLNEVCFNRWGEPYALEDYLKVRESKDNEYYEGMALTYPVKEMVYANKLNKTYYQVNGEMYLSIPMYLHNLIPLEMEHLNLDVRWNHRPSNPTEEVLPMIVTGVYTARWEELLTKRQSKEIEFAANPVYLGMMFHSLILIYDDYFMTEKEREKEVKLLLDGKQVPYYMQNRYLKKIGVIEQDIWRDQFKNQVSLEEASQYFLRFMGIRSGMKKSIEVAISNGILYPEEVDKPFIVDLLFKMEKRAKKYIGAHFEKNKWI